MIIALLNLLRINKPNGGEERLWSEIHNSRNPRWTTEYIKFSIDGNINLDWQRMSDNLEKFWITHGEKYCKEKN